MTTVFVDTFYFVALSNPRDAAHDRAVAWTRTFAGQFVTTTWVLTEFANHMCDPQNRQEFIETLQDLRASDKVKIMPSNDSLWDDGLKLFADRPDKEWSLTDCISFVVMHREGLTEALTGDRHFEQAGFIALLK
jgi:predicted nucleic acid-binding protein